MGRLVFLLTTTSHCYVCVCVWVGGAEHPRRLDCTFMHLHFNSAALNFLSVSFYLQLPLPTLTPHIMETVAPLPKRRKLDPHDLLLLAWLDPAVLLPLFLPHRCSGWLSLSSSGLRSCSRYPPHGLRVECSLPAAAFLEYSLFSAAQLRCGLGDVGRQLQRQLRALRPSCRVTLVVTASGLHLCAQESDASWKWSYWLARGVTRACSVSQPPLDAAVFGCRLPSSRFLRLLRGLCAATSDSLQLLANAGCLQLQVDSGSSSSMVQLAAVESCYSFSAAAASPLHLCVPAAPLQLLSLQLPRVYRVVQLRGCAKWLCLQWQAGPTDPTLLCTLRTTFSRQTP